MGYSRNISTLRNLQPQLQLLAQGKSCRWSRPTRDGHRWAYKIREALNLADREVKQKGEHADEFVKALAAVKPFITIRVIDDRNVEASFATPAEVALAATQDMQPGVRSHTIGEVRSLEDLMSIWKDRQPTNDPIHFPEALLTDQDLMLAADWAATLQPPWMLLRPKGTNSLTLAPNDPRVPAGAKVKGSLIAKGRGARNDIEG